MKRAQIISSGIVLASAAALVVLAADARPSTPPVASIPFSTVATATTCNSGNGNGNGNGNCSNGADVFQLGPVNDLVTAATRVAPGDTIQRALDFTYDTNTPVGSFTVSTTGTAPVVANSASALQLAISRCSVAWTKTSVGTAPPTYQCGGTTFSVVPSGPALTTNQLLSNLSTPAKGVIDHLRITLTFPPSNSDFAHYGGVSATLNYTFTASQKA